MKEKQEAEFSLREAARLREMDEMKTRFFSNVTHEFRTPLTLILSPLEQKMNDPALAPSVRKLLGNNYRHASQLLRLVNQLLDVAKIEGGQMQINNAVGELHQFLSDCVMAFEEQAKAKGIQLVASCEQLGGYFLFDHGKWENIIFNLIGNAIKFTAPHQQNAQVWVSLRPSATAGRVELLVKDTGPGIATQDLPRIFDRFYQGDDSATRQHEGTGIGLALAKELVDLLGGTISVDSEPGTGTAFHVELPVEPLAGAAGKPNVYQQIAHLPVNGSNAPHHETAEIPVILIVEDNDELRSFLAESLAESWKTLLASDGKEAWQLIEAELPDIVVSDVMMPGMNGFELCRKSKQDPRTAHIGFVMLTARAAQSAKIEGFESGADQYLTKPFHMYELELIVRNLLQEQHNLRQHLREHLFYDHPATVPHLNDQFVRQLQDFLDQRLDDPALNTEVIAEAMSMSKSTLNRKLKSVLNTSPNEFVKQFRLKKAAAFLSAGYTVLEVSQLVGFETASYFSHCFKEQFQLTPTEFVKSGR